MEDFQIFGTKTILGPEFMTIFVNWQLIVTLDSIRNSCDVLFEHPQLSYLLKTVLHCKGSRILSTAITEVWEDLA